MTRFSAPTSAALLLASALAAAAGDAGPRLLRFLPVVPAGTAQPDAEPPACADQVCERLSEQLARGCGRAGDVPYADTIFLRRGIDPGFPASLERAIALALASNDPAIADDILRPFLNEGAAAARYAAGLYLALVHAQAGAGPSEPALAAMRGATEEGLPFPASDLDFLEALRLIDAGDSRAARARLEGAIAEEPRFFNALALALRLDMANAAFAGRQGPSLCEAAYGELFDHASLMMALDPCAKQAAHLDLYLSRDLPDPTGSAPYQAVKVYVALVSRRPDLARAARDRFASRPEVQCGTRVTGLLEQLIAAGTGQ